MTKSNYTRKGKPLYLGKAKPHYFAGGGNFMGTGQTAGQALGATGTLSGMGAAASAGVGAVNTVMTGGNKTGVGTALQGLGSAASSIPGIGGLIGAGVQLFGGLIDSAFGSNINEENVAKISQQNKAINNFNSNASNTSELLADFKAKPTNDFTQEDVGTQGWFSTAATDKRNELETNKQKAENQMQVNLANTSNNLMANNTLSNLANMAAFGGFLSTKNKIHNNKFAAGGAIHSGTGVFTNGVTSINSGNTHEENPNEGVQIGVDPQGAPNLVEEGEVIYDDYVYSDRIKANKDFLSMAKLNKHNKNYTYAKIAEKLTKESSERTNDPISKAGLKDSMQRLQIAQEGQKQQEEMQQNKNIKNNKFAIGGGLTSLANFKVDSLMNKLPSKTSEDFKIGKLPRDIYQDPLEIMNNQKSYTRIPSEVSSKNSSKSAPTPFITTQNDKFHKDNLTRIAAKPNISDKPKGMKGSWLRYAPIVGSGLSVIADLAGLTNKPDEALANQIMNNKANISPKPIGNYLAPKPFDREYHANNLRAMSASNERNIIENSGGNRGAATAALLASGLNAQTSIGNLNRQAEEFNRADAIKVEEFNRGTNMTNSQADLQAQQFNAAQNNKNLITAAQLKYADRTANSLGKSANFNNLFDNLGGIGTEIFNANRANSDVSRYGVNMGTGQQYYEGNTPKAKGGKITKRKKGYTYGK